MSFFYHDPRRPHIDGSTIRCPACGQTYDAIVTGFIRLPSFHYPQPMPGKAALEAGYDALSGVETCDQTYRSGLCPQTKDDLMAHLCQAQALAERQQQQTAADEAA